MGCFESPVDEIAVALYSKDEWRKVKACAADVEVFEDTYEDWVAQAERAMGMPVVVAEL